MFDLTNKIALVTGAASGIGEAIAHTFAKSGASVYVADINEQNGSKVAAAIRKDGGIAEFLNLNVANDQDCVDAARTVHSKYDRLDILFFK
jgi:NAD(P)-dependent dehydrogenase (short-subunit alcohol dehydrogenase family)